MREPDIIKYWIKALRKVKEFQELAKVEDHEFLRLYGETERILNNLFIETADEVGIKRFEKIVGVFPEDADTLDQRRLRLYSWWNDKKLYTEEELRSRLISLCGGENFEINSDYPKYFIQIITHLGGYGSLDEVEYLLDYFLPANMVMELQNILHESSPVPIYVGVGATSAMWYQMTNDIKGEYPLTQELYTGVPLMYAQESMITNDVNASYSSSMDLFHGVSAQYGSQSTVTNDISVKAELGEEHTVGQAVSTSRIITIN